MLSIVGFIVIALIVSLLIAGRITPVVGLTIFPILGALVAGFGISEIGGFFESGLESVIDVVIMFVFAILFFGIMKDAGLFDPMIRGMVRLTGGSVVAVAVGTVVVVAVCQLDGSGASTFLITIPALLPLYQKLKMSPYLLMLLAATSGGVMNMLPWGGPIGRSAAVLGMDATELWRPLIPVQMAGLGLLVVMAVVLGLREQRRIASRTKEEEISAGIAEQGLESETAEPRDGAAEDGQRGSVESSSQDPGQDPEDRDISRPGLLWFNVLLTIAVIGVLVWGVVPAGYVFMIGLSIALLVNYPAVQDQMDRIRTHAPNALMMAAIILAAGSFLGILTETGMLDAIATDMVAILPAALVPYLHLIIGVFGLPMDLVLSTDAYYFAMLPIVEQIVTEHGVSGTTVVYAMSIGNIIGAFISPFSPALWLAIGLAGVEMGKHIRYSFFWMWGYTIVLLLFAVLIGVIEL